MEDKQNIHNSNDKLGTSGDCLDKPTLSACGCGDNSVAGSSGAPSTPVEEPAKEKTSCCCCQPHSLIGGTAAVRSSGAKPLAIFGIAVGVALVLSLIIGGIVGGMSGVGEVVDFITTQIIGFAWLNTLIAAMFTSAAGEAFVSSWYGAGLIFFLYDTIKIIALLCILIFGISYVQSFFPPERTKRILAKFGGIKGNIIGALLGTLTPFCSCSSIPLFIGFTKAGVRSGVTFSFLISSPLVDLGALILLTSAIGLDVAVAYVIVGLLLAVVGGTIIEKSGAGNAVADFISEAKSPDGEIETLTTLDRLAYARQQVVATLKKVWLYILIGVLIGALIHNVIPEAWIQAVLGSDNPFAVLIASVVGVPMYADIFGTIPIAEALYASSVGVGTILAFMMSVTALSLPSMIMLSKVVKPKLLITFIVIVVVGIILIGYSFNLVALW